MLSRGLLEIVLLSAAVGQSNLPEIELPVKDRPGPLSFTATTCEKFEENARFNPEDIVDSLWKIFYYWAKGMEISTILFSLPSNEKVTSFRRIVESYKPDVRIEWRNAALFMEPRPGVKVLLVKRDRVGSYLAVVKSEDHAEERQGPHVHTTDIRVKTIGRYMGIINCDDGTAFALARVHDMPTTHKHCQSAAASLGFNVKTGKPYLTSHELHQLDEL